MGSFEPQATIALDGCEVDVAQCELVRAGERQHLTTKEVEVLSYLAENPSRGVSYEELLERVWGHSRLASTQPVYSVIKRLRKKLDGFGEHRHLVTVHGVGYRFEPPPRAPAAPARPVKPPTSAIRLSSFVGREAELARIEALLADGVRLVSLVGPGGAGKTRLALELASRAAGRGLEVVLADLSGVVVGSDVPFAIAAAVGARSEDDEGALRAAARTLKARGAWMLLLENAEHLLDAVASAATELAPLLRVLVTSRERLAVPGEHVVEIGSLPEAEAARLFEERARAAGSELGESAANRVAAIRSIVARLDGLPLAIELAAAHAGAMPFERVLSDLDRQIDRLRATRRGVPPRHTSLRSSVEWSWGLLDLEERSVLAQCVVFAGGFTIEAAEAVVVGPGSVQELLVRLSLRSLLKIQSAPDRGGRVSLYECVRELASEHLPDRTALAARHARWALAHARAVGALEPVPRPSAYADLAPELENLRAAFRYACAEEHGLAAELALAIDLLLTPSIGPGRTPELSLALPVSSGEALVRLRLVLGAAHEGTEGLRFHEESRSLARTVGTPQQALEAERLWAAALSALGEPGAALPSLEAAYQRALALYPESGTLGRLALDLGEAHLMAGRLARAAEHSDEAARLLAAGGEPTQAARAQCTLSHVFRERGEPENALAALERARRLLEDAGDEVALARLALDRGALLAHVCRTAEAIEALETAIAAHHRLGLATGEIRARDWLVLALLGVGIDAQALGQAREIQQLALTLGHASYEAERAFGATWLVTGRLAEADEALGRALEILSRGGKEAVRGHVLSLRALGRTLMGRLKDAEADLRACSAIHAARGSAAALASSHAELALVLELQAERADTEALFVAAETGPQSPWERRVGAARHAMLGLLRARRAGASQAELAALHRKAREALLEGRASTGDYFSRLALLLLDHVAG